VFPQATDGLTARSASDTLLPEMGNERAGRSTRSAERQLTLPIALPKISDLHKSHFGVTEEIARTFAQAACVCFDRHHRSPIDLEIRTANRTIRRRHKWRKPSGRTKAAWANTDDATRDGAYGVCIASVESAEALYAVGRAETRTGADYYLGHEKGARDFERAYRLEISGTDADETTARTRLHQKRRQADRGDSDLPAFAAVVSFRDAVVLYDAGE
jgi:hypothetical protein